MLDETAIIWLARFFSVITSNNHSLAVIAFSSVSVVLNDFDEIIKSVLSWDRGLIVFSRS